MNIRTHLRISAWCAAAIAGVAGAVMLAAMVRIRATIDDARHMDRIMRSVFELKIVSTDHLISGLDRSREQWLGKHETLERQLAAFQTDTEERRFTLARMAATHASLKGTFAALAEASGDAVQNNHDPERASLSRRLDARLDAGLLSLMADANALIGSLYEDLAAWQRRATTIVALFVFFMAALIFSLAAIVTRTAIRPLRRLVRATDIVVAGDLTHRTGMTSDDEVGRLARAFDAMLDHLNAVMASRDALDREIAEKERAQRRLGVTLADLQRSNRDLEQFAYSASHDLQEPLRKVMAFGSLLEKEYGDALRGDGAAYMESMRKSTVRMQTLINDLLHYSRIGTRGGAFVPVNMNAVMVEVLSDLEMQIRERGARVDVGDLPELQADPTQMRQLLQNLIGNALKFQAPGRSPVVRVSASADPEPDTAVGEGAPASRYRLVVEDNGIGFDPRHAERIFGIFQRLHRRDEYGGSGIGLAICRRIAERHGGTITADARPGEGAAFAVNLPRRQADKHQED